MEYLRVNVGCGPKPMKGWVNVDRDKSLESVDVQADVLKGLPFDDNSVDELYAGHFIEHLPEDKIAQVVKEMHRVLKPGGKIMLLTPDARKACMEYLQGRMPLRMLFYYIFLGIPESAEKDVMGEVKDHPHQSAHDQDSLFDVINEAGFIGIIPIDPLLHPYVRGRARAQCGYEARKPR